MLGKAAHFEKPLLASEGYLMADNVRRYGIGLVVPQDNVQAMLDALERLVAEPVPKENFAAFRSEFSEEAAGDSLEQFLKHAMTAGSVAEYPGQSLGRQGYMRNKYEA